MAANGTHGRRWRIGLRLGLSLIFGGLVFFAVVEVLFLGIGSAQKNTTDLQSAQAQIAMSMLRDGIDGQLKPVEVQTEQVARYVDDLPPATWLRPTGRLASIMAGTLAGSPSTYGLVVFTPDSHFIAVERETDDPESISVFSNQLPSDDVQASESELLSGKGHWGPVVIHPYKGVPIINYRRPILEDGELKAVVVGLVRIDELSVTLADIARRINAEAFILHGRDRVLAHPSLVGRAFPETELPLLTAAEIEDPVLQVVARNGGQKLRKEIDGIDARFITDLKGDEGFLTLAQTIDTFGEVPWKVVLSYPLSDVSAEFFRMIWAAIGGVVILVLAVIVALFAAQRIARPLTRLSHFAEDISNLNLHELEPLPRSRFREVDEAAMSMNAMRNGLTWFEAYVPKRLVTRLMASEGSAHLGGEARQITVMFTDIVGFTPMAEHMGAEETAAFLNDHFRLLADAIEEHGGTIDKFIGDAVMAFWGAPEDQSDHSARAIDAALAIREALTMDNQARAAQGLPPVRLRVGIHAGPVVVGNIGAPRRMNYTIVGDTVNTANRLEQAAREQDEASDVTILISEAARDAAGKVLDAREVGEIALRGREHGVRAWLI